MLALTEEVSLVKAFNTPFGFYRYIPFDIIYAQEEFQQKLEDTFRGFKGFGVIADDILVPGKSEEHDKNLK